MDHLLTRALFALLVACGARTDLGAPGASEEEQQHHALHFDGSELAVVADGASLHVTSGTIEAWFRVDATPGLYQAIVAKAFSNATDDSFAIWLQGGELLAGTNVSSPSEAVRAPWTPDHAWHFVAWTFTAGGVHTLTLDGAVRATVPLKSAPAYDDHPLVLGADFSGASLSGQFVGDIDDVRVWSTVRTKDEIASDMAAISPAPATGAVALWNFEEGSGQIAHDSAGSNDARLGTTANADATDPTWIDSPR